VYKTEVPLYILRRSESASASSAEAAAVVAQHFGVVVDHGEDSLLVDVDRSAGVDAIRDTLPGWIVAPQDGAKIPVPDARLKARPEL
jgi:hypothetical protein